LEEVEEALRRMAVMDEPLVAELPRRPGQKEIRWTHLVGEIAQAEPVEAGPAADQRPALSARLERLEELVAQLTADVAQLKNLLS
jgi:uncharacterized protein YceH (UPF0502 family)